MTVTDMYMEFCAPVDGGEELDCPTCLRKTVHDSQSRIAKAPNVLVVQMKRMEGCFDRNHSAMCNGCMIVRLNVNRLWVYSLTYINS